MNKHTSSASSAASRSASAPASPRRSLSLRRLSLRVLETAELAGVAAGSISVADNLPGGCMEQMPDPSI